MTNTVRRNAARARYELFVDERLAGIAEYRTEGETIVFPHTEIDPSLRAQGLAGVLVRAALDDVRSKGQTIVPACWYVAQFIAEHPDYAPLVAN